MSGTRRYREDWFPHVQKVTRILSKCYGDNTHENKSNPLNELLFIISSLQTNEKLYQLTYTNLKARFPTFHQLSIAKQEEIAASIVQGGLSRQKSQYISMIMSQLKSDFGKPTLAPLQLMNDKDCEDYLTSLPGVGRKTARCVMMYSLRRYVFPVDSNCWRISRRIGWVRATRPDSSCSPRDMDRVQNGVPPKLRFKLHVNLVSHGRVCCLPSNPLCEICTINKYCRLGRYHLH